jgi:hypothetical protein
VKLVQLNIEVTRNRWQYVDVTAGCCNLERLGSFALCVNVDELPWLYAERRAVNALTVYEDVAVHNHLAGLSNRASESRAKNQSVESHFEKFYEVFTGHTLGALGFLEGVAKLRLTDTVLGA